MSVMLLQNWVNYVPIHILNHMMNYSVYSLTNVFTYFNDYLMCRSTGANIGGLKVSKV